MANAKATTTATKAPVLDANSEPQKGDVIFSSALYNKQEKKELKFANKLTESTNLGPAQVKYAKVGQDEQVFLIIQFKAETLGCFVGDLKAAENSSNKQLFSKSGTKGYVINPQIAWGYDAKNKQFTAN